MPDSRTLLLAAAAEEFARTGLKGTRIQAIVHRAGVNERMIYHHFGSKDGLYTAVLDEQRRAIMQAWSPSLEQLTELGPYEGMRTALAGLFDTLRTRPLLPALLSHEALAGSLELSLPSAERLPRPFRDVFDLYERGQREGVFRADVRFEVAYATAVAAIVGLQIFTPHFVSPSGDTKPAMLRDQVIGQLLDGMTGPASS